MSIICLILGHNWSGAGWTSNKFDANVPHGVCRILYRCHRCQKESYVDEHDDHLQARFDGYRAKYGDDIVYTNEFEAPRPPIR